MPLRELEMIWEAVHISVPFAVVVIDREGPRMYVPFAVVVMVATGVSEADDAGDGCRTARLGAPLGLSS